MGMVNGDWTITRLTGAIRYIGDDHNGAAPSYATVIEFHRWLQDFSDDAAYAGDDEYDIVDKTASDRSTDNIITLLNSFNIDDNASEHLCDGSIIQSGGDIIYDGIVNFGNSTVQLQLLQDGGILADDWWNYGVGGTDDTSVGAAFLTDSTQAWTIDEWVGYTIKNVTDGSQGLITSNTATTILAVLEGGTGDTWDSSDAYLLGQPLNPDAGQGISHRFMIPTRVDGVDIDQRRLIGTARRFYNSYAEFKINGTSRGNNVLALVDADDLNNTTSPITVSGWTTVTNTEGLRLLDINNDSVNEEYASEWNRDVYSINQFFERMKFLTRDGSAGNINGLNGEVYRGITHSFAYDGETGTAPTTNDDLAYGTNLIYNNETVSTFTVGEAVHEDTATPVWKGRILAVDDNGVTGSLVVDVESGVITTGDSFTGQTSGAKADANGTPTVVVSGGLLRIFAFDDDGTIGNIYGQVLRGRAPIDNDRLYFGGATADVARYVDVNGSVVERSISTPFCGVSTGSALIGSYGFALEAADTSSSDIFTDLSGATINPPNNVTFTVAGLVVGEDYILVGTDAANDFAFSQYTLNGLHNSATQTSITVNGAIESETPASGTLRITRNSGLISRHVYSSWTGSVFTITSSDLSSDPAASSNNVMNSFLDKLAGATSEAFSYVYSAPRTLYIRVRDGGTAGDAEATKTFETTGSMGSNGGSATAIRTADA